MEVIIRQSEDELAQLAADMICELINSKPDAVLGVATGSSPLCIYRELGRRVKSGQLSLSKASAYQLDEYVGLPADHPEGYRNFIEREFVQLTDIDTKNVHGPDGQTDDVAKACREYEQLLVESGGVDFQILGIGVDGHIAFNEPGTSFGSLTHPAVLTRQTRQSNARFFNDDITQVPVLALTQGVGTILRSRYAMLIATGQSKAQAVRDMIEGPVSVSCTGSALQLHPSAKILLDEAAASKLKNISFFQEINEARPQGLTWLGV